MSPKQNLHTEAQRNEAMGMLEGGKTQRVVAENFGVSVRTIERWYRKHKKGQSLGIKKGRGRKGTLSRVAKIVIKKSLEKRRFSTRKLAAKLTARGHPANRETVRRHMRKNLGARPYRPPVKPLLTKKQRLQRLKFCNERKDWSENDWKRVIFSGKRSFELFHPPNRSINVFWSTNKEDTPTPTYPSKIMVWGAMSANALSGLHVVPQKQTLNTPYYVNNILEQELLPAMSRRRFRGRITERKFFPRLSEAIYQQDGATPYTSATTLNWLKSSGINFWGKGVWPANSPDLSPIENL